MKLYIYLGAVLAVLGALLGAGWYIHTNALNKQRTELVAQHNKALIRASEATIELQVNKDNALTALQKKNSDAAIRIKRLNSELLKRPKRTSSSVSPSVGSTCTGAQLYREDGEFLAGEASRAQRIMEERNYYYERYEDARQQIERMKNGKD